MGFSGEDVFINWNGGQESKGNSETISCQNMWSTSIQKGLPNIRKVVEGIRYGLDQEAVNTPDLIQLSNWCNNLPSNCKHWRTENHKIRFSETHWFEKRCIEPIGIYCVFYNYYIIWNYFQVWNLLWSKHAVQKINKLLSFWAYGFWLPTSSGCPCFLPWRGRSYLMRSTLRPVEAWETRKL